MEESQLPNTWKLHDVKPHQHGPQCMHDNSAFISLMHVHLLIMSMNPE